MTLQPAAISAPSRKDEDAEYVECLDCGAILEAGEQTEEAPTFPESLSDA